MKTTFLSRIVLTTALAVPFGLMGQPAPPNPPSPPEVRAALGRVGYLGVGIQEITTERAKELKLKEEAGVEITHVGQGSPADKAGLKVGDVVLQYNGTRVEGLEQFRRLVRETPVGREVKVDVFRNGAEQTVAAKIAVLDAPFWLDGNGGISNGVVPNINMPDIPRIIQGMRSPMLGVEAEPLDGQLADYFGVKDGVLVRTVMHNSAAEKAGIKAGDVILKVDDVKVVSPAEITRYLRHAAVASNPLSNQADVRPVGAKTVALALMRDHKETTLTVTIEVPEIGLRRGGRVEPVRLVVEQ